MTVAYRNKMRPYAQRAAQQLGYAAGAIDAILVQWENESGSGTSSLAVKHNNHGGIKYSKNSTSAQPISGSDFAHYGSIDAFVADYVRVMQLSYYAGVRAAGKTGDPVATVRALGASPYDAGHYTLNGVQGGKLLSALGVGGSSGNPPAPSPQVCPTCHRPL